MQSFKMLREKRQCFVFSQKIEMCMQILGVNLTAVTHTAHVCACAHIHAQTHTHSLTFTLCHKDVIQSWNDKHVGTIFTVHILFNKSSGVYVELCCTIKTSIMFKLDMISI